MRFTKIQMQEELSKFLTHLGGQLAALYGASAPAWTTKDAVQTSPIWETVNEMYDYGVNGLRIPTKPESTGSVIGRHIEVERFLYALNTLPMKLYLDGQGSTPPRLAILAAQCAAARHVLDGGDRRTDEATYEFGPGNGDFGYLTLAEVALLADMDERSVRNAANPKLPNPLMTDSVGRRSLVRPEEARRWLAGRKGFVPTSAGNEGNTDGLPSYDLELPPEFVQDVHREAKELGIPFETNLMKRILGAYERIKASGDEK
ncbi:MAG: hypothetical protein Q8L16_18715 [Hydrogenophaga sp.]|nr:hypothetical protein [Hydrogenophaga sp.]